MVRRTHIVSTRPPAPRKKSSGGLFPKKMFREFLTRDGRKNGITKSAWGCINAMGEKIVEKIIIKTKSEMNSTLPPNSHTSISASHVIHAANCLRVPSEIVEDSLEMCKKGRVEGLKPGRFHRLVQTSCGKSRVRRNTIPLLWCISTSLLDEVIQQATKNPENKNVRVKCEDIFSAIEGHEENLLQPLKSFVGSGVKLGC